MKTVIHLKELKTTTNPVDLTNVQTYKSLKKMAHVMNVRLILEVKMTEKLVDPIPVLLDRSYKKMEAV